MAQKTDLTFLDIKAGTSFVKIESEVVYQFAKGEISWQDVTATEIFLDPDTMNQYLRDDTFTLADLPSVEVQKSFADTLSGFTDTQVLEVQKGLSDSISFTETVDVLLIIVRDLADSFTVSDLAVLTIDKNHTETISISDLVSVSFNTAKTDSFSVSDASALDVTKPVTDGVSLSDVFSKVVTYSRTFSDAFTLDDTSTVNAISKEVDATKTNVFALADVATFSFDKSLADTISFTEDTAFSVDKPLSDSFSFSETVSVTLLGGASSVLNVSALNTFTLNS